MKRRYLVALGATGFLALLLSGCPSEPPAGSSGQRVEPAKAPSPSAPPPAEPAKQAASEADAAPAKTTSPYLYEKQLPLEGNVRFELMGRCTGCTAGTLEAKTVITGDVLELEGEVVDCEGDCPHYRSATGSVVARRLKRKTYTVRSKLRVLGVEPLSLGAAKRTEWALFLMNESCKAGVESLNGNERVTDGFRTKFNECFAKVSPDVRFHTISSMLGWKNRESYVPELIQALQESKTAYLAARVLGRCDDRRAIGPLIEALGSDDESLRWDAKRSLEMITEEELGEDQARWKAWHASQGGR